MPDPAPAWTARTGPITPTLATYAESTTVDEHLLEADLAGSIAHVLTLHEADLVTTEEATRLVEGLQALAEDAAEDGIELDPALEDVHMNVEHELRDRAGPVAEKLHTARSRNDQVALDLVLVTREHLAELAEALHGLATTLAAKAREHVETPWPLHTHGLPGQPATLGYLLHAHALRITRALEDVLAAFQAVGESPLGAGAGAGTTLPIDPAVSADALGLKPPSNGLLTTGARDGSRKTTRLAAQAGHHAQDLAVDLLDLAHEGALELPSAYTTGSSLMPHKANPDALELVRADAGTLASLADAVERTTTGLGLGYQRDLQRAKPPLVEALTLAPQALGILSDVVEGLTVDEAVLEAMQASPSVATTDAAEALVAHGVPFRQAHQLLARACRSAEEQGTTIGEALEPLLHDEGLPEQAIDASRAALDADPAHRATSGGPAPSVVQAALDETEAQLDALDDAIADAAARAEQPFTLLAKPPEMLLATPPEATP